VSKSISVCSSIFTADIGDRDGFAVGFYSQIAVNIGQLRELGVNSGGWCFSLSWTCAPSVGITR